MYINNTEYIDVKLDSSDNILEGIKEDGTKVIGGDLNVGGSASISGGIIVLGNMEVSGVSYKVIKNPEYLVTWVDAEDKVIFGLKTDGRTYVGDADFLNKIKNNQEAINEIKSYIANFDNLDIAALSSITTIENPEFIEAKTDSEGKLLAGRTTNGVAFENVGFSTPKMSIDGHDIENIEDPEERCEITTDAEGKIISYRDSDGVKHEEIGINSKNIHGETISADSFDYTDKNILELIQRIGKDFHCSYDLRLPMVYVTSDLLTVDGNNIIGLDISKNEVDCIYQFISTELSFIDNGTIAYQGNSTLMDDKKGFSMVLSNKHRFKDWIEMDEYRLKGYGQDWTSGKDVICNRLYGQILSSRSFETNKPWKKYNDFSSDNIRNLMSADKKCHMDGFPVELYINDSYWGIYVVCIRKERDNYNLDKKDKKHIQIEGEGLYADSRFSWANIEIRNPKGYDEYVEPEDGDPVKDFITNWFNGISSITTNTSHTELEEYLDCQNFIDWYLHNALIGNGDVISKNTELTTWDRKHMTFIPQDLNASIGVGINEDELALVAYNRCSWLQTAISILDNPIKNRYAELRHSVFTIDNITKLWEDWGREIGTDAYEADEKRWNRGRGSYDSILAWFNGRIDFLDSKFEYNQNN